MKRHSEYNDYKKDIEATECVILCVAKAEKMVRDMGRSLLKDMDMARLAQKRRGTRATWGFFGKKFNHPCSK